MRERGLGRYPAFVAAAALHLAILALALIVLPRPMGMGDVTTVTLMTSSDMASPREADASPTPALAQTETPTPDAPPLQPAPQVAPLPTPPSPKTQQPPQPQPKSQPSPKAAAKSAPADDFFKHMDASLNPAAKGGGKPASARAGRTQRETAAVAHITHGSGTNVSASALAAYQAELMRLWNPNCDVLGGADVNIVITFRLRAGGRLDTDSITSTQTSHTPMIDAAADRAVRAVRQSPTHPDLPADTYHVTFNAKQACAQQ